MFNGNGTLTQYGKKYVGQFKGGDKNGHGTETSNHGKHFCDEYVGHFKDGNYHGNGTMTYPNGQVKEGRWDDGEFMY